MDQEPQLKQGDEQIGSFRFQDGTFLPQAVDGGAEGLG